jgi:hypothetical protein
MDVLAVYDTKEKIESKFTPDLLAQVLFENVPKAESWVSVPAEDDPSGTNWTPQWTDISEAIGEVERFLGSEDAQRMAVDGFTTDELVEELRLFCEELKSASRHTPKFYLCVY